MRSLRSRGDLHATVAVPPVIEPEARIPHASDVELIERVVAEPESWSAHTTWRATVGDGGHEEIVEIVVGDPPLKGERPRSASPFPRGSSLPRTLGSSGEGDQGGLEGCRRLGGPSIHPGEGHRRPGRGAGQ